MNSKLFNIITILLTTKEPTRFFNICINRGIILSGIKSIDDTNESFIFDIYVSDLKKIKEVAAKTKSKIKIKKKEGPYFKYKKHRKEKCFIIGIGFAVFLIFFAKRQLLSIVITGNNEIKNSQIKECLIENGIDYTGSMSMIDCELIEKILRNEFNDITWVSVYKSGTSLFIDIKENDEDKNERVYDDIPCNLLSTCDGIVMSIITRSGTPKVKPNDSVLMNDILVSGEVVVNGDYDRVLNTHLVCADADIVVRHPVNYYDVINQNYSYKLYTGRKNTKLGIKINKEAFLIGINNKFDNYDIETNIKNIHLFDITLPIAFGTAYEKEYIEEKRVYSEEEIISLLEARLLQYISSLNEKGMQLVEKNVNMIKENENYIYTGEIVVDDTNIIKTNINLSE